MAGCLALRPAPAAGQTRQPAPQSRQADQPLDPAEAMDPARMDRIVSRVKWAIVALVALVVLGPALLWGLGGLAALPFTAAGRAIELLDDLQDHRYREDRKRWADTRGPSSWPSRFSSLWGAASATTSRPAAPPPKTASRGGTRPPLPADRVLARDGAGDGVAHAAERRPAERREATDADTFAALNGFVINALWVAVACFMAWLIWQALLGPVRWRQRRS